MKKINNELFLIELSISDLKEYYYWKYIDPLQNAKKWNGPYIEEDAYTFNEFKENYIKNQKIYENVLSPLAIKYNNEFIGVVTAYWKDMSSRWLECGIVIYKSTEWEKGIGSQIFSEWVNYLFAKTDANRIGITTWSGNIRMMKIASKIGMIEESRIRKGRLVRGEYYDAIQMGILREEWRIS
ncbi:GNAT family N-acetyltransferase [Staphylococcus sp. 18_1_E_LY]|uniref:GNAT family N-acetyltransferase n=1 Tax=Staphylococcus lloydii TaxID=2781774 RepID=A0A7T1F9W4_9STAP|nr:GNAT family protein [Staphylococcus lloydii]MBF7019712.1 GNAT family N-acetyltransferase [Staphylococcus lloydii]MBF7027440.1 GNAT family N-acetyltransferase [Staphylococcus lloydii]QPM75100.1 GNAT family N-acetyltransferase [Staphylococcus lloydii]